MTDQYKKALAELNTITDLSKSEGTFMEFMASHEHTIRAALTAMSKQPERVTKYQNSVKADASRA
jgi:hypothetical protein